MIAEAISVRVSVARLKTTLVLVLDELILMSHTVLARDASHMLVLLQILLQIGLQELLRVQLSHIIDIVGASGSLVARRCVYRSCYHLGFRAPMLNRLIDVASGDIPPRRLLSPILLTVDRAVSIFFIPMLMLCSGEAAPRLVMSPTTLSIARLVARLILSGIVLMIVLFCVASGRCSWRQLLQAVHVRLLCRLVQNVEPLHRLSHPIRRRRVGPRSTKT